MPVLPTVATDVLDDDQLPTTVEIARLVPDPTHTELAPLIVAGASIIFCVKVDAGHPLPKLYEIVVDPTATRVSMPTDGSSTVATSISLLLQVPPVVVHVKVCVAAAIHA